MKRRKTLILLLAFVALAGIINCMMIEPVLAYKEDPAVSQTDEAHCCFICHSMHHQWISSAASTFFPNLVPSQDAFPLTTDLRIDPLPASIFHPPLAI